MPDSDGKFTQAEFNTLSQWLANNNIKCASCDHRGLSIGTYQVQINCSKPGLSYPGILVVCSKCSYYNIFGLEGKL